MTYPSQTTGEPASRSFQVPYTRQDLVRKREHFNLRADHNLGFMGRATDFMNQFVTGWHLMADWSYGYRRLTAVVRPEGWAVNHKRVLRVMRTDNLLCLRRRAFVPATTDSRHGWRVVPNLARGIELTGLDQLWVADITYLRLLEELAFLAVVLDAFSRRVIGWAVEGHLKASLALAALRMALAARQPRPGTLIHHADRGVQYACGDYSAMLVAHGIQPSMSRIGSPYDNAKAESFMRTLKGEEVDGRAYRDAADAGQSWAPSSRRSTISSACTRPSRTLAPAEFEATLRAGAIALPVAVAVPS